MAKVLTFMKSRPAIELLLGLCVGLSISIIFSPFIDDLCNNVGLSSQVDEFESDSKLESASAVVVNKNQVKLRPTRPRFASTELGIREKIFFAVLTTSQTLKNRAMAINTTFSSHTLKMAFFLIDSKVHSNSVQSQLPLVAFADDNSAPDALWFHTFHYVGERYSNTFDWFFFVPDSVYISTSNIVDFVERISVAGSHLIGKPLSEMINGASICDTKNGVLMSNTVFTTLIRSLPVCSQDVEPGSAGSTVLCLAHVSRVQNISCSSFINEMVFSYYYNESLKVASDLAVLNKQIAFNKMMTVGLLTESTEFYLLHRHIAEVEMEETRRQLARVNADIERIAPLTPDGNSSLVWPPGVYDPTQPRTRFDVQRWHYFTDNYIYADSDFTNYRELKGVDKEDVMDIVNVAVTRLSQRDHTLYKCRRIVNGYRRFDAARGTDYILDLALISPGNKTSGELIQRVELVRPLGAVEIIPTPYVTESTRVHLILPVTINERDAVLAFLDSYSRVCVDAGDNADLLIVLVYPDKTNDASESDAYSVIKSTIGFYESRFKQRSDARISWMSVHAGSTVSVYEAMMVSFNIMDIVLHRFAPESLVFLCSVGMELSVELLNRVRMNTIIGFQVFFPVGFWAYKPSLVYDQPPYPANIEITAKSGRFDPDRFDHASFYCADYTAARRQTTETGYSPGVLYELFVWYQPSIHVLRAVEPALRLQFREEFNCGMKSRCPSPRLPASQSQLALLVFEHQQRLDRQQIDVMHRQRGENVDQMKPDMI